MKKAVSLLLLTLVIVLAGHAQDAAMPPGFTLQAAPVFSLPLGDSSNYFGLGFGAALTGSFPLPILSGARVRAVLDYNYGALKRDYSVSLIGASAGLGYFFPFDTHSQPCALPRRRGFLRIFQSPRPFPVVPDALPQARP